MGLNLFGMQSANFGFIPTAIATLEKSQVQLVDQLQLVNKTVSDLKGARGKMEKAVTKKVESVLGKNKGDETMCTIAKVLSGENFSVNFSDELELTPSDIPYFKYAPVVLVEVEMSFSMY
ncbi:hypothetical protein ILUMI_17175 [Ignelater luminosus]|uniref:Uncharacterized protein n=1 Tax=Ignelater luminosus TaxID=2038154 RepID=A0A8K0CKC3_IGNLU|nr:hypothetical protein ILUMI_17175 [Ignelater luminosus]